MNFKTNENLNLNKVVYLFCLLVALISPSKVNGQAAIIALIIGDKVASEKFNLSMEIGGSFSQFSNISNSVENKFGLNFGIGGNIMLSENWFLSPNIYFFSKRSLTLNSYSLSTGNPTIDEEYKDKKANIEIKYTDVPIFIAYQTNSKKFRFALAPSFSFLKKSKIQVFNDYSYITQDLKGSINTVDYGIITDFAYILGKAHKGKGLHLHLRYYYGLTDVFKDFFQPGRNANSYLSIHLSLPFITDELAQKNIDQY